MIPDRTLKAILGGITLFFSHLAAFLKGKRAGRANELEKAARAARKRGDAEELRSVIRRSHGRDS